MKVELEHTLGKEKALPCAEKIFKELALKYEDEFSDLKQEIAENLIRFSMKVRGMNISGTVIVNEETVIIESKLPFALRVFQGLIENKIKENADEHMASCN